jgi:hypothetical protein
MNYMKQKNLYFIYLNLKRSVLLTFNKSAIIKTNLYSRPVLFIVLFENMKCFKTLLKGPNLKVWYFLSYFLFGIRIFKFEMYLLLHRMLRQVLKYAYARV